MSAEPNDKKHLTPRQIINRYRKGEYVDESIEAISSAISSCGEVFDSVAIAFPTTLVQKIVENLSTAQTLYERQKEAHRRHRHRGLSLSEGHPYGLVLSSLMGNYDERQKGQRLYGHLERAAMGM